MASSEFQIIDEHLSAIGVHRRDVVLGVGDDAALLDVAIGEIVCASADGDDADARALAARCFDRALADITACNAQPRWATLVLTLDRGDEPWVRRFAQALHARCRRHGVAVVGGDTTRGARAATVFLLGVTVASARPPLDSGAM